MLSPWGCLGRMSSFYALFRIVVAEGGPTTPYGSAAELQPQASPAYSSCQLTANNGGPRDLQAKALVSMSFLLTAARSEAINIGPRRVRSGAINPTARVSLPKMLRLKH